MFMVNIGDSGPGFTGIVTTLGGGEEELLWCDNIEFELGDIWLCITPERNLETFIFSFSHILRRNSHIFL